MHLMRTTGRALVVLTMLACAAIAQPAFYLKSGDRVVFYGDSITDQRLYTTFVETFVRTSVPGAERQLRPFRLGRDVVTGGGGGPVGSPIAPRRRGVQADRGHDHARMNDGRYRPFDQAVFDWYKTGFELMVQDRSRWRRGSHYADPAVSIRRSDAPTAGGGYNPVLVD
ncbi:MAG: hypothetical protein QM757_43265 [Paludibaculum sp.]